MRVLRRLLPVLRAEGLPASSSEPGPQCGSGGWSGVLGKGRAGPAQASLGGLSATAMLGGCSWWAREDAGLSGHRPSSCRPACAPNPSPRTCRLLEIGRAHV